MQEDIQEYPNHIALLTNIYTINEKMKKFQYIPVFGMKVNVHKLCWNLINDKPENAKILRQNSIDNTTSKIEIHIEI